MRAAGIWREFITESPLSLYLCGHLFLCLLPTTHILCLAVALAAAEPVNAEAIKYLNRLSDLLFVLARHCNDRGAGDVLWTPGANL